MSESLCFACGQRIKETVKHECSPKDWATETNRLLNEVIENLRAIWDRAQ